MKSYKVNKIPNVLNILDTVYFRGYETKLYVKPVEVECIIIGKLLPDNFIGFTGRYPIKFIKQNYKFCIERHIPITNFAGYKVIDIMLCNVEYDKNEQKWIVSSYLNISPNDL